MITQIRKYEITQINQSPLEINLFVGKINL